MKRMYSLLIVAALAISASSVEAAGSKQQAPKLKESDASVVATTPTSDAATKSIRVGRKPKFQNPVTNPVTDAVTIEEDIAVLAQLGAAAGDEDAINDVAAAGVIVKDHGKLAALKNKACRACSTSWNTVKAAYLSIPQDFRIAAIVVTTLTYGGTAWSMANDAFAAAYATCAVCASESAAIVGLGKLAAPVVTGAAVCPMTINVGSGVVGGIVGLKVANAAFKAVRGKASAEAVKPARTARK